MAGNVAREPMQNTWGGRAADPQSQIVPCGTPVGAIVIALTPAAQERAAKGLAVFFSLVTFAVTIGILATYDFGSDVKQFPEQMQFDVNVEPAEFRGLSVPPVLLSGNHGAVAQWRLEQSIERTRAVRPDLYQTYEQESPS
mgnify:CR=1 FL=1